MEIATYAEPAEIMTALVTILAPWMVAALIIGIGVYAGTLGGFRGAMRYIIRFGGISGGSSFAGGSGSQGSGGGGGGSSGPLVDLGGTGSGGGGTGHSGGGDDGSSGSGPSDESGGTQGGLKGF